VLHGQGFRLQCRLEVLPVLFRRVFDLSTTKFAKKGVFLAKKKEANFTTNEFKFEQKIELRAFFLEGMRDLF
jgi:hypothetical protein